MRFRLIEDHREVSHMRVMCSVLEVSASRYYAWRARPESTCSEADQVLLESVRRVRADSHRHYGSPRDTLAQELTLTALRMAITSRRPGPGLLHHADRGSQYAAHDDRRLLTKHGMRCSMSRKGDCWDNAPMESFFGSLKTELEEDGPCPTRQAARSALFAFIEGFYNQQRLHSAIGYKAPTEMEQLAAAA
ncbi:IS3 family transposase [Muricoccus aerilatus]|uniref:IS3 family transposase n=1 Tax=Muricoccus aerilatus TaxID=452982 RepID=UPI00069365C4